MDVYFQDKALESTGNYKYSPFLRQKTMLKSGWIISDPDQTTLTRVGWEEGP